MTRAAAGRGEILRKTVHISMVGFALTFRYLAWWQAALLAITAFIHNLWLLPRYSSRALEREADRKRGYAIGIVLYPLTVLALVLMFHAHLEIAAAMWGMLAMGDGAAGAIGSRYGRQKLPWNPKKSWAGSIAYVLAATAAAAALLLFTLDRYAHDPWPGPRGWVLIVAPLLTACFCAFIESVDTGLDDNLTAPLLGGPLLYGLLSGDPARLLPPFGNDVPVGLAVNVALAVLALAARGVGLSGAIAGIVLGAGVYAGTTWRGFILLLVFFVLGTAATKLGYERKRARGIAQERGGRRGASNALANVGAAFALSLMAALAPDPNMRLLFIMGVAGAFATALSDTAASEIGKLWGRTTVLITTFRRVPPGTEGAVSLEGTAAGLLGSVVIAMAAAPLLDHGLGRGAPLAAALLIVAAAGFAGMLLESLLGALLDSVKAADNDFVNFLNTVFGALLAMGVWSAVR